LYVSDDGFKYDQPAMATTQIMMIAQPATSDFRGQSAVPFGIRRAAIDACTPSSGVADQDEDQSLLGLLSART